jgi:hypothetical protein
MSVKEAGANHVSWKILATLTCTATMCYVIDPRKLIWSHAPVTVLSFNTTPILQSTKLNGLSKTRNNSKPYINMPVPMPSSTEKSTSSTSNTTQAENASTQNVASTSHTEKSEQEKEAERLYEERMEEEYAKREGGA